jgi:hypothetical protein
MAAPQTLDADAETPLLDHVKSSETPNDTEDRIPSLQLDPDLHIRRGALSP